MVDQQGKSFDRKERNRQKRNKLTERRSGNNVLLRGQGTSMSRNVPDGHFYVFIFSKLKFYAIYNGENHFQIRGRVAELHGFECGGTTFGTFEETSFKC